MSSKNVPKFDEGRILSASALEEMRRQVQANRLSVSAPLEMHQSSAGTTIGLNVARVEVWAKLTSNSGSNYAWTEQKPGTTAGSWVNGTASGTTSTNPAIEVNGNGTVAANKIVRLRRYGTRWLFEHGVCS